MPINIDQLGALLPSTAFSHSLRTFSLLTVVEGSYLVTEDDDDEYEDGPYYTPECDGLEQNKGMLTLRHEEQIWETKSSACYIPISKHDKATTCY